MGVVGGGAQAELLSVHERLLMPVPPSLTWEQAGGFPEAFVTAHDALFTQGNFVGDRVKATIEGLGVPEFSIAAEA
jgi:NADPH2:quinone reductase